MPRMTAKYTSAMHTAHVNNIELSDDQETLYERLQIAGFTWNSRVKVWEWHDIADADEPTPTLKIRVWADADVVEDWADDLVAKLKKHFTVIDKSNVYLCRPPKQKEGRVYLSLMPRGNNE